ncbi:MAG: prephenate dehydrogenase/arogenate dehydrogenase family protein [Arenicellales bacterium]|jgi:prephenate dehydrogenase|nr:prephenate dehydrogenase/arogenate dehydrogenase family protein [Arenicellales bacterium]MDP6790984.1 prephenate dehydrogenase/arogenate dehydrogenase family protein [Arenicellales bacterium]|tara:strand:+ start:6228 stop:7133 length:906 start_codon:yes stop_codon:yes gene_type:complete
MTVGRQPVGTLAVIGVGLIGGSLAGALKKRESADSVIGCGRSTENLEAALERGLIDRYTKDPLAAVAEADLVLLATPVKALIDLFPALAEHLQPHAVITDAGSVKREIVDGARLALGERFARFVPGHPIAGRERSGPKAADADLFRDHWVVLTPTKETDQDALAAVRQMWETVDAKVRLMDPDLHDQVLGMTSHLPHAVAYALVAQFADQQQIDDCSAMVAGGFLDMTRVASSDPVMWRDIFVHNGENTANLIREYREVLANLENLIRNHDSAGLKEWFEKAKDLRAGLQGVKRKRRSAGR